MVQSLEEQRPLVELQPYKDIVTPQQQGKPWGRLALITFACVFAAGFLPGQSQVINMLSEAGVFRSACENGRYPCQEQEKNLAAIFANLGVLGFACMLPAGLLFDKMGGRFTGTFGAFLALTGYLLLYITAVLARRRSDLDASFNWFLLPLSIVFTDFGSILNSYSLYSMIFDFPGHTSFVIALANSSYGAAAFIPVLMQWYMDLTRRRFEDSLFIVSVCAALATVVCFFCTPTFDEYRRSALKTTGLPVPQHPPSVVKGFRACYGIMSKNKFDHLEVMSWSATGWAFVQLYQTYLTAYSKALLLEDGDANVQQTYGYDVATKLTTLSSLASGWAAITLGPASGVFMDRFGIYLISVVLAVALAASVLTFAIPAMEAQMVSVALSTSAGVLAPNIMQRHGVAYAPPNRIGITFGVILLGTILGMIIVWLVPISMLIEALTSSKEHEWTRGALGFSIPILGVGVVFLIFSLWYLFFGSAARRRRATGDPLPTVPVFVLEDEETIANLFLCASMDQAERVVNVPKEDILYTLSNAAKDPQKQMDLRCKVSAEALFRVMREDDAKAGDNQAGSAISSTALLYDDPGDVTWDAVAYMQQRLSELSKHIGDAVPPGFSVLGPADDPKIIEEITDVCAASFNGTEAKEGERWCDWMLGPRFRGQYGNDSALARQRTKHFTDCMQVAAYAATRFGVALGMRDENSGALRAVLLLYPPGRLIRNKSAIPIGGSRFRYCLRQLQSPDKFPSLFLLSSKEFGEGAALRAVAGTFEMEPMHERILQQDHHWYVQTAAVHPDAQKQKLASKLFGVVTALADSQGVSCYLETSNKNVPIYQRFGFEVMEKMVLDVDDSDFEPDYGRSPPMDGNLMVRKCR